MTNNVKEQFHLKPFDLALTAIMAATNFVICATVAPALKVVIPQVFLGALIMDPMDLFFAYTTWAITRKNIFVLYFLIFGLLTVPTTIWGNTPGIFKPFLGLAIGLLLDLLIMRLNPQTRLAKVTLAVVFPCIFWSLTAIVWSIAGLPIVQIFQTMVTSAPFLNSIVPAGFISTFLTLALLTMPSSFVAITAAVSTSKRVEKIVPVSTKQS